MPTPPTLHVAIIGSGPAGCYLAQSLLRALPGATLTLFDRLVSPFGLIRYGIAADHQHTKAITRQFERLFQSGAVRFAGDIEVGRDVSLEELRAQFDAVVLATGLSADRSLGVPGSELTGVVGSGEVTRILNAHPDEPAQLPELGSDIVIVGAGNVALDLLRFLVKSADDFTDSDVAEIALHDYASAPASRITLVSRSSAASSKGDPQMIKELAALERASYATPDPVSPDPTTGLDRTATSRVVAIGELVSPLRPQHPGPRVTLRFGLTPQRVLGSDRVEAVEFSDERGTVTVPATAVLTAIGFDESVTEGVTGTAFSPSSDTGRVAPGLYRTGWAKRGPRGAIPENRACAKSVAEELVADLDSGAIDPTSTKLGFDGLSQQLRDRAISYAEWLVLDAHEREQAPAHRVRRKLPNHTHMANIARGLAATYSA